MKVGIDVDMSTNIAEGYLIMEFKKRELIKKGKLDMDVYVRFYCHYPDYALKEMYGTENPVGVKRIMTDVELTGKDLWEMYQEDKKGIDSFIGDSLTEPFDDYTLLHMADSVNAYRGLE